MEPFSFDKLPEVVLELFRKVEHLEELLANISRPENQDLELMTVQEAAEFLKISVPAIYTKVSRREIPVYKPGRRLYFSKKALIGWAQDARLKTQREMSDEAAVKMKGYRKRFGA